VQGIVSAVIEFLELSLAETMCQLFDLFEKIRVEKLVLGETIFNNLLHKFARQLPILTQDRLLCFSPS